MVGVKGASERSDSIAPHSEPADSKTRTSDLNLLHLYTAHSE